MPKLFLPEIETLADQDPMMYEILFRMQQSINTIPVSSGAATPTPTPAIDPATGNPLTDVNGNPLYTIPQQTGDTSGQLPATPVDGQENGMYVQTDPTGDGSGIFVFGGIWQPVLKIVHASDLAGHGTPAKQHLIPGTVLSRGAQFDDHGRPASSFYQTGVDASGSITGGVQPLTQIGVGTGIAIAATTWQFGEFQVSYNSGSVNPGAFGTYNIFLDDPQFNGGIVGYTFGVPGVGATTAKRGRLFLGAITTAGGGGGTGNGGGSGGGGGRGSNTW